MATHATADDAHPPIGMLLREWRAARRMSQLDLSLEAGISTRHLSCIETGKARASRETVARLADTLGMPLRERNALLRAAGYAAMHPERALAAPALDRIRQAVDLIIAHQEPYPAFVISRHWDVLMTNAAAVRVNNLLTGGRQSPHANLIHQLFDPADFRSVIVNWPEVAGRFIRHLHDDLTANPTDRRTRQLLEEVFRYPGVPQRWRLRDLGDEPAPIITFTFRSPRGELRFFETFTSFAAPHDVTLDEIRIDCTFPADEHTAGVCAELVQEESEALTQSPDSP
ncbi:helix-turn-helix transcriptional regulator [Sphingomonas sp. JC676]|uniref:helix-turn-helix domain-containing protein n=1 Tax=Sphingomonas sp. JC676 TaxID=2768065 RepID=UPI001658152F|nr:helix-turn-helix transcriptional regulator [Sphingomonas sp. JC676]MBC9032989.1 helix-turn-helix transcriptional regulator [Sphingomonas sp. JC676]